jgi:hypothetical protein
MFAKPKHLISLATSGLLVSVDVNVWSATKQNKAVSDEVTSSKNASAAAGRYTQHLLADHPKHKAISNYRQTVYNWLQRRTYMWNKGNQYLPQVELERFKQEYDAHKIAFDQHVESFVAEYDNIVTAMAFTQSGLGDMFNRNDYPPKEVVRGKFNMRLFVSDVPLNDFRCQIAQDIADDLFETYSKQTEEIVAGILQDQQDRFIEVMKSISYCCDTEEVTGKNGETKTRKRKIYESTLEKAREMCETFRSFNLTGNAELEAARAALEDAIKGVSADTIRDSDAVRSQVKGDVDDILGKFGSFSCV